MKEKAHKRIPTTPALRREEKTEKAANPEPLTGDEETVIRGRFGLGEGGQVFTFAEIAEKIDQDLDTVTKLQETALNKIRAGTIFPPPPKK